MVKNFKAFNESNQSNEDIDLICKKHKIKNYKINDDGSIDVDDHVDLSSRGLVKIPLKFRNISGSFRCHNNKLITLEDAPQSVGGDFDCSSNKLTTLEGAPQSVGSDFCCNDNKLTTLEGTQSVGGDYYCHNNKLTTLKGAPKQVRGNFYCDHNELTTLKGTPQSVGKLLCNDNPIYKWFSMIDSNNEQDVEAFLDFDIHSDDPDEINQEKIDMINNS